MWWIVLVNKYYKFLFHYKQFAGGNIQFRSRPYKNVEYFESYSYIEETVAIEDLKPGGGSGKLGTLGKSYIYRCKLWKETK